MSEDIQLITGLVFHFYVGLMLWIFLRSLEMFCRKTEAIVHIVFIENNLQTLEKKIILIFLLLFSLPKQQNEHIIKKTQITNKV